MATQYQKKRAMRRKTSDIERLSRQYQQEIAGITGEQEAAYGQYQKDVGTKMAPYESAVSEYLKKYSVYETEASAYKKQIDEYQAKLEAYKKSGPTYTDLPLEEKVKIGTTFEMDAQVPLYKYKIEGKWYNTAGAVYDEYEPIMGEELIYVKGGSRRRQPTIVGVQKLNPAPEAFSGTAPKAPEAPTSPTIDEFDVEPFKAKQAQAEQTLKREVGERRAAKLGAVSRKATRPLLGGAAP